VIHRWIGIVSCLLFAMWFVSGLVMIYVPYPALTPQERLAGLDVLSWPRVNVQPAAALATAGLASAKAMTLEMRDGVPVWRIDPWDGPQRSVAASAGAALRPVDAALARRVAAAFGHHPVASVRPITRDQWTVAGGFDRHRPLWKATLADAAGTVLYVSSSTGGIVQDTTRHERFWNWLGSVPHWLYPTVLRQDNAAWRQVVLWVSGPCIAAAITGMWIGLLRTRAGERRYKHGRVTPYHGWMLWHHVAGLTGGVALLLFIFSGWLSVDPGRLFASPGIGTAEQAAYAGAGPPPPLAFANIAALAPGARQMRLTSAAGHPFLALERPGKPSLRLDPVSLAPAQLSQKAIVAAAEKLVPGAPIRQVERLDAPDAYWYAIGARPVLPVLRVKYADKADTWVHLAPETGALLGHIDTRGRVYRWLFDFFHKWDANGLTLNRPAWDIVLWGLSILGLITSISGIWIGWLRLMRPRARSAKTL
jgi:hypothetical protein